jgi:hypothetical protein
VGVEAPEEVVAFGADGSVDGETPAFESGVEPAGDAVSAGDVVDDEALVSVTEPESAGMANAVAGDVATAMPTPSANASGPTRPMKFALLIRVPQPAACRTSNALKNRSATGIQGIGIVPRTGSKE